MDKQELLKRREQFVKAAMKEWGEDVKPTGKAWWADLRNDWKLHLITVAVGLFVFWLIFWPSKSHAAPVPGQSVVTGSVYAMQISLCLDKRDAIAILDAEKIDHEHASKLFDKIESCNNFPVQFRVGPVVHTMTNSAGKTFRVVEIQAPEDEKNKLYWITSMNVLASVTKPGVKNNEVQQPIDARGA